MSEVASGINLDKFDTLIRRRHEKRVTSEGERLAEALYQESVRRHNLARDQERRAEWAAYHRQQAQRRRATLTDLVRFHEEAAACSHTHVGSGIRESTRGRGNT